MGRTKRQAATAWLRRHVPLPANPPVRHHHPIGRRGWARRLTLGAAGALLLSVALVGHVSPAQATGIGIRLSDLVSRIAVSFWDGGIVELSNLDAHQTYEVVVSSSNPRIVGIGDCLAASKWSTFTGSPTRSFWMVIRGCAQGQATVTVEVFQAGAPSAAASLSHHMTTAPFPNVVPHQRAAREQALASLADVELANQHVRNILAGGIVVQRPFAPRLFGYVSTATTTTTIVSWATWWASAPTGGVDIIGYQMRYWPNHDPSRISTVEIANPNLWKYRLTGLVPDAWHTIKMRACTNQAGCTAAEWSYGSQFRTLPG
ncbi:MAG: fibronectin type III domain-containing protein [Chloroflexi bacterium]|nr:fibronectin type III domain-containing protein [Chloroflexota bacterium]